MIKIQTNDKDINKYVLIEQINLYDFLRTKPLRDIKNYNPPVSFDNFSNPISYWNDEVWDFSKEKLRGHSYNCLIKKNDYRDLSKEMFDELKYLSLISYLHNYKNFKYSYEIQKKAATFYLFLSEAQKIGYTSLCDIKSELEFISLLEKIKGKYTFETLKTKLNDLRLVSDINNPHYDFHINFGLKQARKSKSGFSVKELAIKYSKNKSESVNQTLYIPSRIHSKLISTCIDFINEKRVDLSNIMNFLEDDYLLYEKIKKDLDITKVCDNNATQKIRTRKLEKTESLLKHHNIPFATQQEVHKEIRLLTSACIILILNFSGMRLNELYNIQLNGFRIINSEPLLYVLRSYETKISGGQTVDYITSPIVKDAVDIITQINSLARKYDVTVNNNNLFISSNHKKLCAYGTMRSLSEYIGSFSEEIGLVIENDDVKESELLNGPRENVKEGNVWPLMSHQFRRTLIVNFVSHRLGSINAVKQQVKHMYATMTEYYAKNSRLAETFQLNVVQEIADNIEEELLNEGVRQYKDFYYSNEPLSGVRGKEIVEERKSSKVLSDNEIKQLFKTGLLKISKSMYGYCTKGNLCDKKEAIDPTFCGASCSTMIITKENASNWQKLYFRNKKLLDNSNNLIVAGIPLNAAKTTMQSQNEVAKKIMNDFNIKYED